MNIKSLPFNDCKYVVTTPMINPFDTTYPYLNLYGTDSKIKAILYAFIKGCKYNDEYIVIQNY